MNWQNVKLIFQRELRDQLRDRRTLFMIFILPLMLYPLLGMAFLQLSQFLREHRPQILVVGGAELVGLDDLPPLFEDKRFTRTLVDASGLPGNTDVHFLEEEPYSAADDPEQEAAERLVRARSELDSGQYEAVIYFPPDFGERLTEFRREVLAAAGNAAAAAEAGTESAGDPAPATAPVRPEVYYNSASEKSQLAYRRVESILNQWALEVGQQNLRDSRVPPLAARPFQVEQKDVAVGRQRHAALWSKILPFIVIIWALTGAFYPAVDLCAGEKERGTLETLLSSPALRNEIVWGKLLTVMIFSILTALLNLFSLGFTGKFVMTQLSNLPGAAGGELASPPLSAALWLVVALVPVAALFSALCLALASLARSTKEGQYYLMPLVLITMPLMILPMSPGVELNLGNSLIPITGLVLFLRMVIEGNYLAALPYLLPVVGVTLVCCLLAIRWAVEQFNRESVLFRESERLDLGRWILHLIRDRRDTPTTSEALACVILIFIVQFFVNFAMAQMQLDSYHDVVLMVFISQVVVILLPGLMMTLMLTRRPLTTLLLNRLPKVSTVGMAVLLALVFHPVGQQIGIWIQRLYPPSEDLLVHAQELMRMLIADAPYAWVPFVLIAVLPAICEELTFRGFVLSGLRHLGHKWWAIGLSAVFFGMVHSILQQSLAAMAVGVVIGFVAVQTGSLVPCFLVHCIYNGLTVFSATLSLSSTGAELFDRIPTLRILYDQSVAAEGMYIYNSWIVALGSVLSLLLFVWFYRLPYQATEEERLEEIRDRSAGRPLSLSALPPASADSAGEA